MGALLTGGETEVSQGFSVSGTSNQKNALSGRGSLGKLVESQDLAAIAEDSLPGSLGELEGAYLDTLGELKESVVICDGADEGYDGCVLPVLEVLDEPREGEWVPVESGLVKPPENDFVE